VYTLSIKELNIVVLFQCSDCKQYNAYVAGHVLTLDSEIMSRGDSEQRRRHVVESLQLWACEFAGNVLKNVERVVDVNMELDLKADNSLNFIEEMEAGEAALETLKMLPSKKPSDAPAITDEEMRDFICIDLNLIDKTKYFKKIFGNKSKKAK
jgi:hypothetical protein